ncbi:MAG: bifunctional nuclease family protein [Collinsella sp.]
MFHGSCRHRDHRHGRRSRAIAYRASRTLQQVGFPRASALLSIQTGSFEAAAISRGIDSGRADRPITHDLLLDTVGALGAKLERIEIVRAEPPVFYATIVVLADGDERKIDARPSDAIALAAQQCPCLWRTTS